MIEGRESLDPHGRYLEQDSNTDTYLLPRYLVGTLGSSRWLTSTSKVFGAIPWVPICPPHLVLLVGLIFISQYSALPCSDRTWLIILATARQLLIANRLIAGSSLPGTQCPHPERPDTRGTRPVSTPIPSPPRQGDSPTIR